VCAGGALSRIMLQRPSAQHLRQQLALYYKTACNEALRLDMSTVADCPSQWLNLQRTTAAGIIKQPQVLLMHS
jgi:hypothetical protein